MREITIELLADYGCDTGENPHYHPGDNCIYWTDIPAGRLFRYDLATGEHSVCYEGEPVGGFTVQEDGALLLFMARGAIKAWRDGKFIGTVHEEIVDERETRFNDVFADPEGRVFGGTMPAPDRPGRLYRLDTDGTLTIMLEGIGCSNGMGFTPDGKQMYYTDTGARTITRFAYDRATGSLSEGEIFITVPRELGEGAPDGMTVDADGNLWSARWGGGCIVRYSGETGVEIDRVRIPRVTEVSSLSFGGLDYSQMYITTASGHRKGEGKEDAGALFRVTVPGVHGVPEFVSRVRVAG